MGSKSPSTESRQLKMKNTTSTTIEDELNITSNFIVKEQE